MQIVALMALAMPTIGSIDVSIYELHGRRKDFDGDTVRVAGFANSGFEANMLCPTVRPASLRDCFWVDLAAPPTGDPKKDFENFERNQQNWNKFHGEEVVVVAKFSTSDSAKSLLYGGVLEPFSVDRSIAIDEIDE